MTVRFFTGVYSLPSGYFLQSIGASLRPSFGEVGVKPLLSLSSLVIGSMTSTAFLCHFSAPDFYNSLKRNSVKRFSRFTLLGFGLTMFLTLYMTAIGFLTFGTFMLFDSSYERSYFILKLIIIFLVFRFHTHS